MGIEAAIRAHLRADQKASLLLRRRKPAVLDLAAQIIICVVAKDRAAARNMALAIREALHGARIDGLILRHIATDYFLPGDRGVRPGAYIRFRRMAAPAQGEGDAAG